MYFIGSAIRMSKKYTCFFGRTYRNCKLNPTLQRSGDSYIARIVVPAVINEYFMRVQMLLGAAPLFFHPQSAAVAVFAVWWID